MKKLFLILALLPLLASGQSRRLMMGQVNSTSSTTLTAITSVAATGTLRNDYGNYVGWSAVAGANITVTQIGRWVNSGNSQSHTLGIFNGTTIAGLLATVSVNCSGATTNQFLYATLASPISISSGQTITVASVEINGGDTWHNDNGAAYTFSSDFSGGLSRYSDGVNFQLGGGAGLAFCPINIVYTKP